MLKLYYRKVRGFMSEILLRLDNKFIKDESSLHDYAVLYARYLVTGDFEEIEEAMKKLAKKGQLHALSAYLFAKKPIERDKEMVALATELEKRDDAKTPEEWEVIAALHANDNIMVFGRENITCIADLMQELVIANKHTKDVYRTMSGFFSKYKYQKGQLAEAYNNYKWLFTNFKNTDYAKAIMGAQVGYYRRFLKEFDMLDASLFLEFSKEPDYYLMTKENFVTKETGSFVGREKIYSFMKSALKAYRDMQCEAVVDSFAFNSIAMTSTSKGAQKKAFNALIEIANTPLLDRDLVDEFSSFEKKEEEKRTDAEKATVDVDKNDVNDLHF